MACHLYQQAAGTFQKLRRGPASEVLGKKPPDLGSDALEMVRYTPLPLPPRLPLPAPPNQLRAVRVHDAGTGAVPYV